MGVVTGEGRSGGRRFPPRFKIQGSPPLIVIKKMNVYLFEISNNFRIKLARPEDKSEFCGRWFDSPESVPPQPRGDGSTPSTKGLGASCHRA